MSDIIKWVLGTATWPVSRVTQRLAAVALIGTFGLAAEAAAQVSDQPPTVSASTLTPERIAASVAAVVGLIGAVIGGLALARSAGRIGTGHGRRGAIVALVMGPIGLVIGGLAWGRPRQRVGPESVSHDHDDANLSRRADLGARTA